ncbi:hypothetical protein PYCCODRAFT_1439873 [Trametes coccinea BRFM310]|uniref:Transmembrane protein n=1 Tax=Trametes coccinea (strain BRFM310) TaxID=1353009 RepID=A0A1Y2I9J2_TRAC3|nr:hypothetical protein PYCCODRAFT_1439873 [Trametes coccinea BRFM310]
MVDWQSQQEIINDSTVFLKFIHAIAGLYFWEFVTSLDFEWGFITRQKRFHYPAVFYFLNRYCLLFTMIGLLIALDTTVEINCQALYTFNQITGQASSGLASINLSIRTMALWSHHRNIVIPIVVVILGHWSLILQGVLVKASWVPGVGCQVTGSNNTILAATFIYSMCFDLGILLLSMYKLVIGVKGGRSQLMTLLFKDGLVYFIIAFLSNLLATVFILLNLNPIMSVIFNVPAAIFSTIVACRAVRRLTNFSMKGPEVFSSTGHSFRAVHPAASANTIGLSPSVAHRGTIKHKSDLSDGVHVQMQTFTVADEDRLSDYNSEGDTQKARIADPEMGDAEISAEFKRPPY